MTRNHNHKNSGAAPEDGVSRRDTFKCAGVVAGVAAVGAAGGFAPGALIKSASAHAGDGDKPLRLGFQVHRTGIGAAVFDFAHRWPALYGLIAVALAVMAGLAAGQIFRRR